MYTPIDYYFLEVTVLKATISHIVVMGKDRSLGQGKNLLWETPEHLALFRKRTVNSIVIMGRKTLDIIGKPLSNATNIIVSNNINYRVNNAIVLNNIENTMAYATSLAKSHNIKRVYIIGGAKIYQETLPFIDSVEATIIDENLGGELYYPDIDAHFISATHPNNNESNEKLSFLYYQRKGGIINA